MQQRKGPPIFKSLSGKLGRILVLYGGWGLFAISFLDSSVLSFPLVNDLLLIHLSSQLPGRMALYVLQTTLGSVLGAYVVYAIGYGGARFLSRKFGADSMARARRWIERNDFMTVLVASLLPPPAPFKLFMLAAGGARVSPVMFGAALLVGRGLRFAAEGLLAVRYGARAEAYLKANLGWASLAVVAVLVTLALVRRRVRKSAA